MPELTAWLRLHLSHSLSISLVLFFFHLWLLCCSSETSASPLVSSPCLPIRASSTFCCGATLPPQVSWGSALVFCTFFFSCEQVTKSYQLITLFQFVVRKSVIRGFTKPFNLIQHKWGTTARCAHLWNFAPRQTCWIQSFHFNFWRAAHILNKFLCLYHFSCEITPPISGRSIDLLFLSISQEDFCPLIFRLISIKGNLCPSLSDHLLAARKHCGDGKNIMSALHKKPLIAPLEEKSVYFDQEDKVNVKKVKF